MKYLHKIFEGSHRTYDLCDLDLPIPNDLSTKHLKQQWSSYIAALPMAALLEKFGEGLDIVIQDLGHQADFDRLSAAEKQVQFAKAEATQALGDQVHRRLNYPMKGNFWEQFESDVEMSIAMVVEMLESIDAPDVDVWQERRNSYRPLNLTPVYNFGYPRP